ncbi:MATE family efflux transporter [Herbivorax sp. ANBcel31]|uniref:MATE family efflux transporter n=1 Tax=Herbivorax sp. ANBcel31 TaxID=3069754 RepID=UPI0027B70DC7|nr:MATE family efflux transporter [Herbivorax sp. ANBcel31]MDQ2087183.1 MATE family efflux transporter [Herbivorax sp. ANBcel31]
MPNIDSKNKLTVAALTWPIFIEMLFRMLLGNLDTIMLSRYSDNAVAAVGVVNQINHILIMLYWVVSMGTAVLISQHLGAKNEKKASEVVVTATSGTMIYGVVIGAIIFLLSEPILLLLNVPDELMSNALIFLRITGGLSFTQAMLATLSAIIRSYGHTRTTMYITAGMNILNIIGNSIFIFGLFGAPRLGVLGVAISTVTSQILGFLVMLLVIIRNSRMKLNFKYLRPLPVQTIKEILKIGIPSAGEGAAYHLSQLAITRIITEMGTVALTTKVYTNNIMMFIMIFGIAMGQGTQIVVGHLVGAGKKEEAYKTCLKSLKIALSIVFCMSILIFIFSKNFLGIFTDDHAIIELGSKLLLLAIFLEPGRVFNVVIINSLRASGDVKFPVVMGVFSMWGIAVFLSFTLGLTFSLGLIGVWIALGCDEWCRGLIMLFRWKSRAWQDMSLTDNSSKSTGNVSVAQTD